MLWVYDVLSYPIEMLFNTGGHCSLSEIAFLMYQYIKNKLKNYILFVMQQDDKVYIVRKSYCILQHLLPSMYHRFKNLATAYIVR